MTRNLALRPTSVKPRRALCPERVREGSARRAVVKNARGDLMEELIEGKSGKFVKPSLEEQIRRLKIVVAMLATEIDTEEKPRRSAEEMVERILYAENFR